MRHAKSSWDSDATTDFERPLAKRGKGDAPRMGQWILEQGLLPDHIVSSPALRAKQTALKACKAMGINKGKINWDPRVYGAGTEDLLEVLAEVPSEAFRVMLVGHNPGMEFIFNYLAKKSGDDQIEYTPVKTATVVVLDLPEGWKNLQADCANLVKVQYPRELVTQENSDK
ncbi:MAG: histidine phosphatase family protein, partial [Magnetococcales bacterium]|nr:histidine phosphatase family protein [Magnetococcales bacterium]